MSWNQKTIKTLIYQDERGGRARHREVARLTEKKRKGVSTLLERRVRSEQRELKSNDALRGGIVHRKDPVTGGKE